MERDQLDARHTAVLTTHWRSLLDNGGRPPRQLLDGLAAIAEGHKPEREQIATVLDRIIEHSSDADIRGHLRQVVTSLRGAGLIIVDGPPSVAEIDSAAIERAAGAWLPRGEPVERRDAVVPVGEPANLAPPKPPGPASGRRARSEPPPTMPDPGPPPRPKTATRRTATRKKTT